ncbi:MAG: hypothetical protein ABI443_14045 [Chthoniobacterales bacterium]
MRNEHTWKERTEDGEKREVRVTKEAGLWRLQSKVRGDEAWTYHKHPSIQDLETFRELLQRKYQRKRAAYEDILLVDRMIHENT